MKEPSSSCMSFLLLSLLIFRTEGQRPGILTRPYRVHIFDNLDAGSGPLTVRCKSKDDDLGLRNLYPGNDYSWHFNERFLGETLFFCRFWWMKKTISFTVFHDQEAHDCNYTVDCYWSVRVDGFYFSNNMKSWKKRYDWPSLENKM
ncbi:hypothetical protein NMG60_11017590 [Bertholletia excelsa]